jgi:hypothetical protein
VKLPTLLGMTLGNLIMSAVEGWMTKEVNNAFNYVHGVEIAGLFFKGSLALSKWPQTVTRCHPATVADLYSSQYPRQLFDNIIQKLFNGVIHFNNFKSDDFRLHMFGDAMLGQLIMYHPEFVAQYGEKHHIVVQTINCLKHFNIICLSGLLL